jgi:predicted Zn-dependent protease
MTSVTKKILIFLLLMGVIAGIGWFGRRAYKASVERHLVAQAGDYLGKKDFPNAALCLERALQMNPLSHKASEKMADLLEAAGSSTALNWRMHAAQLESDNSECRFNWAQTALKLQDPQSAAQALSGLNQQAKTTATYHKLQGALAWEVKNAAEAENHYQEALRLEPGNETLRLNLTTVRLASTNKATADAARSSLEQIPANSPLRSVALRHLVTDAQVHRELFKALGYSKQILSDPAATFEDKMLYLDLLRQAQSSEFAACLSSLEAEAQNSAEKAYALGRWKLSSEGSTNTLAWLQALPVSTLTNQPLPLLTTDCLVAKKDWNGLLRAVDTQDWGEANSYRLALQALARRSLGQDVAAETAWRKALRECSRRLDRLTRIVKVTELWGWKHEKTEALREIIKDFPKEKWAVDQIIGELYVAGNTLELTEVLKELSAADPSDARMKNWLANVFLLRKIELERAYRLASEAYNSSTNNPFFVSTYAYSLFLQKKETEAVTLVANIRSEDLQIPTVAAYYGVIQASTGHKDVAEPTLQRAQAGTLLPEEKEIVKLAMARL